MNRIHSTTTSENTVKIYSRVFMSTDLDDSFSTRFSFHMYFKSPTDCQCARCAKDSTLSWKILNRQISAPYKE